MYFSFLCVSKMPILGLGYPLSISESEAFCTIFYVNIHINKQSYLFDFIYSEISFQFSDYLKTQGMWLIFIWMLNEVKI